MIIVFLEGVRTKMRQLNAEYYPIFKLWGVKDAMINIRHPDDAEVWFFFNTCYSFYLYYRELLYADIALKHEAHRKRVTVSIHASLVRHGTTH